MALPPEEDDGLAVPSRRLSRMAKLGGLASGIAGNMLVEGAKTVARGKRPAVEDLLLTPANAAKVAEQLSQLRGAAMKVGQLLSMDAGDVVPPELAEILAKLRAGAHPMPPAQLKAVLNENWGQGWLKKFSPFEVRPMAAASIGQVHRAKTKNGRDLAIKIQYPGVKESVDSDVDNVATLIRLSGLLPKGVDIAPLFDEAKQQLHEEADYEREGRCLEQFRTLLKDDDRFLLPALHEDLTTSSILAMDYVSGVPIEEAEAWPQEDRNRVVSHLLDLMLSELFVFRLMQTDPNFANYQYNEETGKLILLDFGATRAFSEELSEGYRAFMRAGWSSDREAVRQAALNLGFLGEDTPDEHQELLVNIIDMGMESLRTDGPYDFGDTDLTMRVREQGVALRASGFVHMPPTGVIFLHRKFAGIFLLAGRLKAKVDVGALVAKHM
ncbi:MAG: AarF/ABC1/UbiB kinase family protein [Pseudomonadota bacterium]